jgi:hypothetical protein
MTGTGTIMSELRNSMDKLGDCKVFGTNQNPVTAVYLGKKVKE